MFDIGWQELFLVALVTIIVVGPKELPRVLRTVTLWIRKMRTMASQFQDGIEEMAREADLDELRRDVEREVEKVGAGDLEEELEKSIDPTGELGDSVREIGGALEDTSDGIKKSTAADKPVAPAEIEKSAASDAPAAPADEAVPKVAADGKAGGA